MFARTSISPDAPLSVKVGPYNKGNVMVIIAYIFSRAFANDVEGGTGAAGIAQESSEVDEDEEKASTAVINSMLRARGRAQHVEIRVQHEVDIDVDFGGQWVKSEKSPEQK